MSSVISSGANYSSVAHSNTVRPQRPPRPDPSALVDQVFSQLDTANKGYLNKTDVQTAYDKIASSNNGSSTSSTSSDSASKTDAVFKALDSNSDGQITKQEFKDGLKKLSDQLDAHFNNSRTKIAGQDSQTQEAKGPPPPPPPHGSGDSTGKTESSDSSSASSTGSSTTKSYDPADTNKDGTVSEEERLAYTQSHSHTPASSSTHQNNDAEVLRRVTQLLKAYGSSAHNSTTSASSTPSTESKSSVSVTL